mmetsp:Transcript_103076/g.183145  ORF Transcript_103076/g.183145 Transcript_103076/m.183145 type:complete len:449 (+) Transcript_103076:61-1407(+)
MAAVAESWPAGPELEMASGFPVDPEPAAGNKGGANKQIAPKTAGVLSTGPPGAFFSPPQVQVPQSAMMQMPQVPRRFPGHFMPHRLCNHWNAQGWCRKAETCTFAHGLQELHPDVQAQLLQQQPGMPPPTVTKDGRLLVHGNMKGGKASAVSQPAPVTNAAPILSFPPPGAPARAPALVGARSVATGSGLSTAPSQYAYSYPPANFEFNVGAQPFVPFIPSGGTMVQAGLTSTEELQYEDEDEANASSSSPSKRRPAPAPLTLDDSPANAANGGQKGLLKSSPTAEYAMADKLHPLASPMRVSVISRPSPTHAPVMSPTSRSVPKNIPIYAPPGQQVPTPMASPARVMMPVSSPSSQMQPTSPSVMLSPKLMPMMSPTTATEMGRALQSPKTPVPIDRSTFLQARQVALNVETGPPGLAMWAPTPTTKASLLGFRYPQPGYISAAPRG